MPWSPGATAKAADGSIYGKGLVVNIVGKEHFIQAEADNDKRPYIIFKSAGGFGATIGGMTHQNGRFHVDGESVSIEPSPGSVLEPIEVSTRTDGVFTEALKKNAIL